MGDNDLYKLEHTSLRSELDHTKNYQLTLLAYSSAATGIVFGLSATLPPPYLLVMSIFLVSLLLGAMKLYIEKAKTICIIVGYLRVLEKMIQGSPELRDDYVGWKGWENHLKDFRKNRLRRTFWRPHRGIEDVPKSCSCLRCPLSVNTDLRKFYKHFHFMPDLYILFLAASLVSAGAFLLLFYRVFNDPSSVYFAYSILGYDFNIGVDAIHVRAYTLIVILVGFTGFTLWRLYCEACLVAYGDYSYDASECDWREHLRYKSFVSDELERKSCPVEKAGRSS